MTHVLVFDTLGYANKLKAAGVPDKQAEVQAEAMAELIDENIATKKDIKELELNTKQDIRELELRMVIKLGGLMVGSLSLLVILMKLFRL